MSYQKIGTGSEESFYTYWSDVRYPGYVDGTLDDSDQYPSMAEYCPLRNQENRENQMVKNIMVAFVAGPESSYITGANLTVDGGMNA